MGKVDPLKYEYCVMHSLYPDEPHRGPMSEDEARKWVAETIEMFPAAREDLFYVARRPIGNWERVYE